MLAALRYAGSSAQLTGQAAGRLHGLRRSRADSRVHVLVPHHDRRRSVGYVLVERTRRLPEPVVIRGLACAPVERAVLDHARRLREPAAIQSALAEAVQRGYCSVAALRTELDAGTTRGTALVRRELPDLAGGARSVAEFTAKRLVRRSALPEPAWNARLIDPSGSVVGEPDAWWADFGLAWEIDSHEFHLLPTDHARTLRRNARYAVHGVAMLGALPSRLASEPAVVLAELEQSHRAAGGRAAPVLDVEYPTLRSSGAP